MSLIVNQVGALGLPAPGFPSRDSASPLLTDAGGGTLATFTAKGGLAYVFPSGGTVTLPAPTGSRAQISLACYGTGVFTLSGTQSLGGVIYTSYVYTGDQTFVITDADATRGWV